MCEHSLTPTQRLKVVRRRLWWFPFVKRWRLVCLECGTSRTFRFLENDPARTVKSIARMFRNER